MELQKVKHELKMEEWRKLIYECRNSGQTIKAWCKERHICLQTYYRWQRTIWDAETQNLPEVSRHQPVIKQDETMVFAECRIPAPAPAKSTPSAAVILHLGSATLEIQNGACLETVETVLKAVKALC